MAGTIPLSLTQRYDKTSHEPLDGGKLYFFQAGTSTPQDAFQDIDLTIEWPNPITLDSGGNIPQLFFADGYIKFRLTNEAGVTQIEQDYALVIGPSSGGGGAPSVDATTIMATGDIKARYGTGALTGFVRLNGRTIGNAVSGATERANADTSAAFVYLYNADANLTVSGGRGASAAADYAAGKTIALPDFRGRAPAGLDDMGNTSAARLSLLSSTTLGAAGGAQSVALSVSQIPTLTSTNAAQSITVNPGGSSGNVVPQLTSASNVFVLKAHTAGADFTAGIQNSTVITNQNSFSAPNSISVTSSGTSGADHANIQPTILLTYYLKL